MIFLQYSKNLVKYKEKKTKIFVYLPIFKGSSSALLIPNFSVYFCIYFTLTSMVFSRIMKAGMDINIIRIGTSGAIQEDLAVGSEVMSEYGVGMDNIMWFYELVCTDFEKEIGQKLQEAVGFPFTPYIVKGSEKLMSKLGDGFIKGNTVTSPGFYAPQGRHLRIPVSNTKLLDQITFFNHKDFWLTNFEMETSMLYAMARMLGHQALSINAILGNRVQNTFSNNPYKAIDSIIKKVLDRI